MNANAILPVRYADAEGPMYRHVRYDDVVSYEFLLPLTREDHLRQALDGLFYSDAIARRLHQIGLDRMAEIVPRDPRLGDDEYLAALLAIVGGRFVGYGSGFPNRQAERLSDARGHAPAIGRIRRMAAGTINGIDDCSHEVRARSSSTPSVPGRRRPQSVHYAMLQPVLLRSPTSASGWPLAPRSMTHHCHSFLWRSSRDVHRPRSLVRRPWCILLILENAALAPADGTKAYARLRRAVINAGILEHDPRYYTILIAFIVIGITVSLVQVIRLPVSVSLVGWSLVFSLCCVQVCGIVHDAGHRAIFRSTMWNTIIGEVSGAFLAMGFDQWRVQHNVHHARTNDEGEDPDLKLPLHAFTTKQFHAQRGVWYYLRRYQLFSFYPMRTLVVFSRRLSSIEYFRTRPLDVKLVGAVLLWTVCMFLWFGLPFLIFPLAKSLLLFAVVHITMGFYLSNIFAPNHKGMPQISSSAKISFLEQQIRTSRNITPNWAIDFLYMGLNYQIEHHLFPTCPRHKLKRITPYVIAICQELGLEYTQVGVFESHRIVVAELNRIAQTAG